MKGSFLRAAGLVACLFMVNACDKSNFQQDPYAGQPDSVRNPVRPGEDKIDASKPIPSDALKIEADEYFSFKEGYDGGAKIIVAHMLIPVNGRQAKMGEDFIVSIKNISNFPGATYDSLTGEFKWIPPYGTVDVGTTQSFDLEVEVYTKTQPIMMARKSIAVFVARSENDPEIVSVDGLTQRIREGEKREFTVTVKDPDGDETATGRPRLLVVASSRGAQSAAHMVTTSNSTGVNPMRDPQDPSKWIFRMAIEPGNQEITASLMKLNFGLVVISRHGRMSAPTTTEVEFYTRLQQPVVSWKEPVPFIGGQPNVFTFTVYDPPSEGRVEVVFSQCASSGAVCKCRPQSYSSYAQVCTVTWTPPNPPYAQHHKVSLIATTSSPNPWDTQVMTYPFSEYIRVEPGPTPTPAPTPEPTPAVRRRKK